MRFTKGPLRLQVFGVDISFDDNLRLGRHIEVYCFGLYRIDRPTCETTRDGKFVDTELHFLRAGVLHDRRAAEDDADRHLLLPLLVALPMNISAGLR